MEYHIPIYLQLKETIIKRIEDGEYLPGEMIPSEREMAKIYGINRMTVKNAIRSLVDDGYLYSVHGKGTFVKKDKNIKLPWGLPSNTINEGMGAAFKEAGMKLSNKVIYFSVIKAYKYIASKLNIEETDNVFTVQRIRYGNDEAIAVEYAYLPMKYFEDIEGYNFEQVSLYDYMESKKHLPVKFKQNLIVTEVKEKELKHLNIEKGKAVYRFEYIGYDSKNTIVEYTESYLRTDKAVFRFNINNN